jgi:heptosyltransferase III
MTRCAVFSCMGLGDGLIALVLSNNLQLNGGAVETFHPFLGSLQEWFPHLPIRGFPSVEKMEEVLAGFDRFFIILEKTPWMQSILEICQKKYPKKTTVLNPIATPNRDYPYWESGRFDGNRTFVENLYAFCKDILKFNVVTKSNGIVAPEQLLPRRFDKRVVMHPTSSREGKNWPREKYLRLAHQLREEGYSPAMILTEDERKGWDLSGIEAPHFAGLPEMAAYVCESGYMIGNDSGIGHLASCLGLPTLTICRSAQNSKFWRPSWARGEVVLPSGLVPNIKGLRLRDQHWKKWISVGKVLRSFSELHLPRN